MSSTQPSQKQSPSGGDINAPSASAGLPQSRPLAPPTRQGRPRVSRVAQVATGLSLVSALFGLAAAALLVRPLLRGDLDRREEPHLITLQPTASSAPSQPTPPPSEQAPSAPKPVGASAPVEAPVAAEAPAAATAGVQENRTAFKGALLMIDSRPSGAVVRVNGINQGEAPVTVGLDCTPGTTLNVSFALRGYESLMHHTTCPKDALVKVTAQLHPGSGVSRSTGKTPGKHRAAP